MKYIFYFIKELTGWLQKFAPFSKGEKKIFFNFIFKLRVSKKKQKNLYFLSLVPVKNLIWIQKKEAELEKHYFCS